MLKYVLLASAMALSVPALAQTAPMAEPMPTQTAPTQQMPTPPADQQAMPMDDTASQTAQTPATGTPADPADSTMPAQTAQTAPAQPAEGVAGVVEKEFASYDKNSDGQLSKTEFAAWMDALKAKSGDAAAKDPKWNDQAFAQADADKSKSVTKVELTGFLSGAAAGAS